ncbi:MAG: helix-turn-helix domain-containing protein [Cellvibrionaceae bacterium]
MQSLKLKFGLNVKALRTQQGLSQESLADLCDCSIETISHIERGIHGPRFDLLEKLASALECPVRDLFDF